MKIIITIIAAVLSALFLVPFAGADSSSEPKVSGKINHNTQLVKYTGTDGDSRSVSIRINRRTQANNSLCNRMSPPTCSFEFGKNKNPKLTKQQIRFIKKGYTFKIVVGKKPGVISNSPTYFFTCSAGLNTNGSFSCKLKSAPV